jgi:hypothetical protein
MIAEALAMVVEALEGEGLRVATRVADVSPPVVYVHLENTEDTGALVAGGLVVTFACRYIPIRGVDNALADAEALDALFRALRPLAMTPLSAPYGSVTLNQETWPCYRADLAALALEPSEAR